MIDRSQKQQLIERQLGLKHKLKVNESGPTPQNHKEMASITVANWELEDEIDAIDEFLTQARALAREEKLRQLKLDYSSTSSGPKGPLDTKGKKSTKSKA